MSSRTAASSDAVGSSATTSDGAAHDRLGNENPLALTAAQLVRIGLVDALRVVGQTDLVHRGQRTRSRVSWRSHRMWARTTSPICAPTVSTGLSASADSWKTMPIAVPRSRFAFACGQRPEVASANGNRAGHRGFSGQQTEQRQCHGRLAGPDGPDMPTISRASTAKDTSSSTPRVVAPAA